MPEPKNDPVAPTDDNASATRAAEERAERAAFERMEVAERAAAVAGVTDKAAIAQVAKEKRTPEAIRAHFMDLAERGQVGNIPSEPQVTVTRDAGDKVSELISGAILSRSMKDVSEDKIVAHNQRAKSERARGYDLKDFQRPTDPEQVRAGRYRKLIELAAMFLEARGISTKDMGPNDIAGHALAYRSGNGTLGTTSDFSGILGNAANKMLWAGYAEVESPWRELIGVRMDQPDFKQFSIYRRSGAPDLEYVNEHGEVKRANYNVPNALTGQLRTSGIEVGFTRQMLINDDLNAFAQQSLGLGDAARRFEDDFVISTILLGNPTLADSVALFHSSRGNLSTDTGTPDLAAISEVARLFAVMTETIKKAGNNAGTTTRKITQDLGGFLAAFTESLTINQILRPEGYTPTAASSALPDFLQGLKAHRDVRLNVETSSPDVYFGFAKNRKAIAYGYLEGESGPRLTQFQHAGVDGPIFQLLNDWYGAVADPYALVRVPKS